MLGELKRRRGEEKRRRGDEWARVARPFGPGFCIGAKKGVTLGNLQISVLLDIWGKSLC